MLWANNKNYNRIERNFCDNNQLMTPLNIHFDISTKPKQKQWWPGRYVHSTHVIRSVNTVLLYCMKLAITLTIRFKAPILYMVNFKFTKNNKLKIYSQIMIVDRVLLWIALKSLFVVIKVEQIRASSGPERIFRFINITEFPSSRTLLES